LAEMVKALIESLVDTSSAGADDALDGEDRP
jgi:hypothetical protein